MAPKLPEYRHPPMTPMRLYSDGKRVRAATPRTHPPVEDRTHLLEEVRKRDNPNYTIRPDWDPSPQVRRLKRK